MCLSCPELKIVCPWKRSCTLSICRAGDTCSDWQEVKTWAVEDVLGLVSTLTAVVVLLEARLAWSVNVLCACDRAAVAGLKMRSAPARHMSFRSSSPYC